jgi:uncharacterized protein (TIGR00255 family)
MIRSMTGFGSAEGAVGGARVSVEVRAVNHRFFNPSVKLPNALAKWEVDVRETLRREIGRGAVTLVARIEHRGDRGAAIDEARFAAYVSQLRELEQRYGLEGSIDVATVLRLPDVLASSSVEDEVVQSPDELLAIVARAAVAVNEMRAAEGARLVVYIGERLALMDEAVDRIAARAPRRVTEQRERLRASVAELMTGGGTLDEARLEQEIAILADRLDVSEELSRFRSHLGAFRETLRVGGADGVGKRLGFLLQELLREANTTGSKANDAGLVNDVVLMKEELERIREQVENLE